MNFARALAVMERNVFAYRRRWPVFVAGLVEPFLYLLSIGIGVGRLVGTVPGPGGRAVPYDAFVAPGMLAASAMNGAILDTTYNFFFKFRYEKSFTAVLATPVGVGEVAGGELAWGLARGTIYGGAFLVAMVVFGLVESAWAVLALPVAMLIGFAFSGAGMAATTYMRSFVDLDKVALAVIPMFLFSATFFPLARYPGALAGLVRVTPLYQGVALLRAVTLGELHWSLLGHVAYLVAMGLVGLRVAAARLGRLLSP